MSDECRELPYPLPCPFCGESPTHGSSPVYHSGVEYDVFCHHCGKAGSGEFETEEQAIAAWNHRAPSEAERKLQKVREAMERCSLVVPEDCCVCLAAIEKIMEDGK